MMILPGATLGVIGGGQLGQMFVFVARRMGYQVVVLDPDINSPAGAIAHSHIIASYQDQDALDKLASSCAAITTEFENVPADSLRYLAGQTRVAPDAEAVEIAQHRGREKAFFKRSAVPTAKHALIQQTSDCDAAWLKINQAAILKTTALGYDGKGQLNVASLAELKQAFADLKQVECILEQRIDLAKEVSIVVARNQQAEVATYPLAENLHHNGILHTSKVPAAVSAELAQQAKQLAITIVTGLNYCGVLAVEFFVTQDGQLLVNEIAPRPHNSGHYTQDACVSSQFEQQIRMLCNLPMGSTRLLSPVAMLNLLGDLWDGGEPDWQVALDAECALHLYAKTEAKPGRKMGHLNCLATTADEAELKLNNIYQKLKL